LNIFRATVKSLNTLCTLHGHRLLSEIYNEYAAETMLCQSQAFPPEKSQIVFFFIFEGSQNFKIWLQKAKLATLHQHRDVSPVQGLT